VDEIPSYELGWYKGYPKKLVWVFMVSMKYNSFINYISTIVICANSMFIHPWNSWNGWLDELSWTNDRISHGWWTFVKFQD
jgi:hypothetical protein